MAKFIFGKKIKDKEKVETEVKTDETVKADSKNKKSAIFDKLVDLGAGCVNIVDDINEEMGDIFEAGVDFSFDLGAWAVIIADTVADLLAWLGLKLMVLGGRKWHDFLLKINEFKGILIKDGLIILGACIVLAGIFAWGTIYEYSYNGRVLGYVKEQSDVVDVLDIVSEELSLQHKSNISIDPQSDIAFRTVVSAEKEIDDSDTVLNRFTYLTEIHTEGYAIIADGKVIAILETEDNANKVLDQIKALYTSQKKSVKYEHIGFAEKVVIEPYSTTLNNISSVSGAVKKIKSGGKESAKYTVKNGDTLYGICDKVGLSLSKLQDMNPGLSVNSVLHAGDKLNITQLVPLLTVETTEVSTFAESVPYKTEYKKSSKYYQGDQVVTRYGQNGKVSVTARLVKRNGKTVKRTDLEREVIIKPVNKIITKGTATAPPKKGTGKFQRPVNVGVYYGYGWRWGRMHYGLDYAAPVGTPIKAADGGTVIQSGWNGAYGYSITINHGNGFTTLYAHCSSLNVRVGQKVYKGQLIGAVGNTGRSTGPHCHFEIKINGVNVNPSLYV